MKPRRRSQQALLHSNPFSKLFHVRAEFEGFVKDYYITHFGPRAGIVAVRAAAAGADVLLVRQYRLLPDELTLEIPGGKVEADEAPADAVTRECLEETGYRCQDPRPLVVYYPGLDNVENRTSLFYSEEVERAAEFQPDPSEVLELAWVPLDRCLQMIFSQELTDAMTIMGILAYFTARGAR